MMKKIYVIFLRLLVSFFNDSVSQAPYTDIEHVADGV
jgi:hypothetical protein